MKNVLRTHPVLSLAFGLAATLTLFFVVRAVFFALYWADPAHALHPVEDWMTPRYIVHAYSLRPESVAETLEIAAGSSPRTPLAEIAEARGVPVETLILAIEALVAQRPAQ